MAEALCLGTPIIVPDQGGAADLAQPAYAGTYRAGNCAAAAKAILDLLSRDRSGLSQAALQASSTRIFAAEEHFTRLFAFYEELVRRKPA